MEPCLFVLGRLPFWVSGHDLRVDGIQFSGQHRLIAAKQNSNAVEDAAITKRLPFAFG
jgi:hypothetical protein